MTDGDQGRARRTVTGMSADVGHEVEESQQDAPRRRGFDWGLQPWGNRLFYSIVAGAVVNFSLHTTGIGTVVAVVLFVLTSAIVLAGRRR
jgi:hypothetical protein